VWESTYCSADPSGHGEAQRYAATIRPNANGCFTAQIDSALAGAFVTATATDVAGNASEFSAAIAVRAGRPAARRDAANEIGRARQHRELERAPGIASRTRYTCAHAAT
jgi:hypothetical protein